MSLNYFVNRRTVLRAIGLGTLAAAMRGAAAAALNNTEPVRGLAPRVAACVSSDPLLSHLGLCYLRTVAAEANVPLLLSRIGERWPEGTRALERMSFRSLRHALSSIVRRDFESADVVLVNGWVLARSEARLFGVVHLLRNQQ